MNLKLYAYKDCLLGQFGAPFVAQNDAVAVRKAKFELSKVEDVNIAKDTQLYCLGEYDFATGSIISNVCYVELGE